MISFQRIYKFTLKILLTVILAIAIAFDFGHGNSWAKTFDIEIINQSSYSIATMNRVDSMTKNLEGKAQETLGNMTGDPKDQIMGKAKQLESQARNKAEDIKDNLKLNGRQKAIGKNIEGKIQEATGNITGNSKDQMMGKAKQLESQTRNTVENLKDGVKNLFN
jgi:uncharacterized protein YjbJ (UPF0337 family)